MKDRSTVHKTCGQQNVRNVNTCAKDNSPVFKTGVQDKITTCGVMTSKSVQRSCQKDSNSSRVQQNNTSVKGTFVQKETCVLDKNVHQRSTVKDYRVQLSNTCEGDDVPKMDKNSKSVVDTNVKDSTCLPVSVGSTCRLLVQVDTGDDLAQSGVRRTAKQTAATPQKTGDLYLKGRFK